MYKTCGIVIAGLAGLGLLMWALVGPDVEGIPTRVRPYGTEAFLVFPKYRQNRYSLAKQSGTELKPYPSREAHERGDITNAVDIHLDSRGTLWVLDSGMVGTLDRPRRKSAPRVLALDADSGKIKSTVNLEELVRGRAQFLEVEETKEGPRRLYVSDGPARCIAVVDVTTGHARRLRLPRAVSHPSDVLYLALIPPSSLFFTYYKSPDMYMVNTAELTTGRGLVRRVGSKPPGVVVIGREGRNMLFRVSGSPALYSWDTERGLDRNTFLRRDPGSVGDPLHAVADLDKTWVLEADLRSFLEGKRVSHRIRTIDRSTTITPPPAYPRNPELLMPTTTPPPTTLPAPVLMPTTTPPPTTLPAPVMPTTIPPPTTLPDPFRMPTTTPPPILQEHIIFSPESSIVLPLNTTRLEYGEGQTLRLEVGRFNLASRKLLPDVMATSEPTLVDDNLQRPEVLLTPPPASVLMPTTAPPWRPLTLPTPPSAPILKPTTATPWRRLTLPTPLPAPAPEITSDPIIQSFNNTITLDPDIKLTRAPPF